MGKTLERKLDRMELRSEGSMLLCGGQTLGTEPLSRTVEGVGRRLVGSAFTSTFEGSRVERVMLGTEPLLESSPESPESSPEAGVVLGETLEMVMLGTES